MHFRNTFPTIFLAALFCFSLPAVAARQSADVSTKLNASALQPGHPAAIAIVVDVHPTLHLQSHTPLDDSLIKFEIKPDPNPQIDFHDPIYPTPEINNYAALGKLSVYTGHVIFYLPFTVKPDAPPGLITITGRLTLQACNEGTCFPPEHPTFTVQTSIVPADQTVTSTNADTFAGLTTTSATQPIEPTTEPIAASAEVSTASGGTTVSLFGHSIDLQNHSVGMAALVAFLAGIIFNVVPCVLPVLPVKAVGFYEASQHNRARTILLGLVFSLGLVAIFAGLGMVVLLSKSIFGKQFTWGQWFSYPAFVWGMAIFLACLGFGMMGAFSVNLPTSIYGLDFRHDTLVGNFLWGSLTALLSTPCTAPLFPPVLVFALTLPRFEGFFLVTFVGCGMASPYLILSAFPELARRFPRTGAFSELFKQMMGFLLLGSASFFAGLELFGQPNQWWVVFAVTVWACLYMVIRAAQISKTPASLYIATGLAVAIGGGALRLTLGLTDVLAANSASMASVPAVNWVPYTPDALADARKNHQIVLIDFTADWCLNCKYIETTVYRDPTAIDVLHKLNVLTLRADLTNSDAIGWQLHEQLGANGIPFTAIYLPDAAQPVGLSSIYTTPTLLNVLNSSSANTSSVSDAAK
jgi:thiol:disulfide interchange protein